MERKVRVFLWISILVGFAFSASLGLAAGDRGMIQGAAVAAVAGAVVAPFVARWWR